jgi:hypothetical protein
MKKLVLVLLVSLVLVFAIGYVASAEVVVKAGYDLGSTFSDNYGFSSTMDGGFSLGFEYAAEVTNNLMVGGGLEYQLPRNDSTNTMINFIPIYGLVQYKFSQFYVVGRLGYDLYNQNPTAPGASYTGGIYYEAGAGFNINKNMAIEAVYGINSCTGTYSSITKTGIYSKLGLSFGYKF